MNKQTAIKPRPAIKAEVLGYKVKIDSLGFESGDGTIQKDNMLLAHFFFDDQPIEEDIFGFDVRIPATSYPTREALLKTILAEAEPTLAKLIEQKKDEKAFALRHEREESLLRELAEQLWLLLIKNEVADE